ncbi:hypothetical protein CDEST_07651 [Colletotrichum destructivum]|uniref:Uncharacterized protein n=1 Tax=Colletotrichum destructivum TaxID=34406 RepID=A0AAX4IH75_9PEZI|nr:hypothetical protein CDEST_07651 [Colletotrichum destructivum]
MPHSTANHPFFERHPRSHVHFHLIARTLDRPFPMDHYLPACLIRSGQVRSQQLEHDTPIRLANSTINRPTTIHRSPVLDPNRHPSCLFLSLQAFRFASQPHCPGAMAKAYPHHPARPCDCSSRVLLVALRFQKKPR